MVHVVHVSQPTTAGVARCVVGLVTSQVAAGFQVTVVCPDDDGWLARESVQAGGTHRTWAAGRSPGRSVPRESLALQRLLHQLDADLVHLHSSKAGLVGRLALRGSAPTVFQPHAWSFLAANGAVGALTVTWERHALRWTDSLICVSQAELDEGLAKGLQLSERAVVVPNGVDTAHYAPRDQHEARTRLGLGEGPLVVCVGRLSEQKGQDVLLRAWADVRRHCDDAILAMVGDGPLRERLTSLAGDGVLLSGSAPDPRDWYAAADVVVVPSRWEGMALVPLEAAASARSVVITDVAGARDAVPQGAGAVVPVEDAPALAAAVLERVRDRGVAFREGRRARRHVETGFTLERTATRTQEVYDDVLAHRRAS